MAEVFVGEFMGVSFPRGEGFIVEHGEDARRCMADLGEAIMHKKPIDPADLPRRLEFDGETVPDPRPDIFGGYMPIVSERVATVLRAFDIGAGAIFPMEAGASMAGRGFPQYYGLHVGTVKDSWDEAASTAVDVRVGRSWIYYMALVTGRGTVVMDASALTGPDIWREAHGASRLLFFSAPLAKALLDVIVPEDGLRLYPCRVEA